MTKEINRRNHSRIQTPKGIVHPPFCVKSLGYMYAETWGRLRPLTPVGEQAGTETPTRGNTDHSVERRFSVLVDASAEPDRPVALRHLTTRAASHHRPHRVSRVLFQVLPSYKTNRCRFCYSTPRKMIWQLKTGFTHRQAMTQSVQPATTDPTASAGFCSRYSQATKHTRWTEFYHWQPAVGSGLSGSGSDHLTPLGAQDFVSSTPKLQTHTHTERWLSDNGRIP